MGVGHIFDEAGKGVTISDVTRSSLGLAAGFLNLRTYRLQRLR